MAWLYLVIAGAVDATWITLLKIYGFKPLWLGALILAGAVTTPFLLNAAMKTLPLGTSYVVAAGVISLITVCIGIFFLGESASFRRLFFLGLIIAGIIGLRLLEIPARPAA